MVENCHDELIGHASKDSTAIEVREKPCRRKKRTCKMKKKRGRKSKAEKAALQAKEKEEIRTRLPLGRFGSDFLGLVPEAGVEPARCRHHWILSPARLPIPSFRHIRAYPYQMRPRYSCGARNCLRLGAARNFDRCAIPASLLRPPDALRR